MSSSDPDAQEAGFFMKSTINSVAFKFPSVKNVETPVLAQWLTTPSERTVVILDSRDPEEYVVSHLKDAIRVDYKENNLQSLISQIQSELGGKPNPTIVCYCSLGYRSSVVAKNLQNQYKASGQAQIPEIYNLAGSLFKWANEGRQMVNGHDQPTKFAHPYTAFWGKLLNADLRKDHL